MKLPSQSFHLPIPTPEGVFMAVYSQAGLCGLEFPDGLRQRTAWDEEDRVPSQIRRWHTLAVQAVRQVVAGRSVSELPPLDLDSGTTFQKRVWKALRGIPAGQTQSYGEVAATIGQPGAARAVGTACGANPIPLFVPCHRVLASHGKLGGFSGGLHWKRLLLKREQDGLNRKPRTEGRNPIEFRSPKPELHNSA